MITKDIIEGLNVALNEAQIFGIEFDKENEYIAVTFSPISIDQNGEVPTDNRVQFVFKPIGKFFASYRLGNWDDNNAEVLTFEPEEIFDKIKEFEFLAIYGWEFIDNGNKRFDQWKNKLSFDYESKIGRGLKHTIDLFQEGNGKHIDLRIWFDEIDVYDSNFKIISLQDFIENGKRGWGAVYYKKGFGEKFGIVPLKAEKNASNVVPEKLIIFKQIFRKLGIKFG